MLMTRTRPLLAALALVAVLAGCSSLKANEARRLETEQQLTSTQALLNNQPLPVVTWSQLRQNLIELARAQSDTTQTTSFFFNQGIAEPVMSCPSVGFPIPNTMSLSNPWQPSGGPETGNIAVGQIDPTGVYVPASSSGTFVICVNAQGLAYASYWEGFVQTVTGPAVWNREAHQVELTGPPSFKFSKSKTG
jgi:hypothetical protein